MISHLCDCIEKKYMIDYGGLLTWIFEKCGVPLEGLHFPLSSNNKIGVECLTNLHLKLTDKITLEAASIGDKTDYVEEESSIEGEKEKDGRKEEKRDQELVPTDIHEEEEVVSKGEQEEG